jgi:hypothetical protein
MGNASRMMAEDVTLHAEETAATLDFGALVNVQRAWSWHCLPDITKVGCTWA